MAYLPGRCRFVFEQPIQAGRLVKDVADRAQQHTQRSWKRPYGAGLLTAAFDKTGAHLFYNCPSGAYYDYKAMAIGARSQVMCWHDRKAYRVYSSSIQWQHCLLRYQ